VLPFQLVLKRGSGKRSAPSVKSYKNPVKKSFSAAEDQMILKPSIQSLVSFETIDFITITDLTLSITSCISFEAFRKN
jgi:hypothetical protein